MQKLTQSTKYENKSVIIVLLDISAIKTWTKVPTSRISVESIKLMKVLGLYDNIS